MISKRKQYLWYWLSRLTSRGIPFISIGFIYGIFANDEGSKTQLTGMATLALGLIVFFFYKDMKEKVQRATSGWWSDAVGEAKWLVVCILLLLFLQWVKLGIGNLEVLLLVVIGSQGLAVYPATVHRKYVRLNEQKKATI